MPTQASFFTSKQFLDKVWSIVAYPLFALSNILGKFFTDEYGMIYWFALFGFFMFLYLRSLGLSYFASFVGGIAFLSCTGFVSLFYPGHHSGKVPVIGMMPLILFFLHQAFEREKHAILFFLIAGFLLARTMTMHIQIFFLLCVSLVVYLFFKIMLDFIEKKDLKRVFKFSLLSAVLFLMAASLNADQLLPRLEFKKYTHRGSEAQVSQMDQAAMPGVSEDLQKYYFVTSFSQPPEDLLGLFMRYPFGMGKPYGGVLKEVDIPYYRGRYELRLSLEYVGVFVFILAILGAIKYIRMREVKLIVILGIISILLSLGKYTILFDILYKMPGFKNFRIPLVYIMVSFFSFAALCGFGVNYIEDFIKKKENGLIKKFFYILSGITLILGIFTLWGSFFERETITFLLSFELVREMLWGIYQDVFQRYALFFYNLYFLVGALILTCLFLYLTIKRLMPVKVAYLLIPLAIALDLWTLNNKFIILIPKEENVKQYMGEDNLVRYLKEDKSYFRIKSTVDEVNNRWVMFGISNIEGYHPTPLKNFEELYSLVNFSNDIDSLLNIKYLLLDPNDQLARLIEGSPLLKNKYDKIHETTSYSVSAKGERPVVIYRNKRDFGRAFFVYNYGVVDNNDKGLSILANPNFNPREIAILNEKPKNPLPLQIGSKEKIQFKNYTPNYVELEVENDGNALLIFSENWYPAWKAYIDGNRVELLRAYNTLRAVFVPAGRHKVEFKYESDTLKYGIILFWISFGSLLIAIIYELYKLDFVKKIFLKKVRNNISFKIIRTSLLVFIFSLLLKVGIYPIFAQSKVIILATTTSTQDSGLLDILIPLFEKKTGFFVKTIAVGSGQAIAMGKRGECDVLLVHSPDEEKRFVAEGYGINRRLVMHNNFIIVGPSEDPAKIKGLNSAVEAFRRIAAKRALFLSRGDNSGTFEKEKLIWKLSGIDPEREKWYQQTGLGMGQTLAIASEKRGYTFTDRGTYLALKKNLKLDVLLDGDRTLLNIYHVIEVNPNRWKFVNNMGAREFSNFLVSKEVQDIIGRFGVDRVGAPLFFPDAGKKEEELIRS